MARSGRTNKEIFTTIFNTNHWKSKESLSGPGSEIRQTEKIRRALPRIFKRYGVRSMLDIPCGDFNWMRRVDLDKIQYLGADIVKNIIGQNKTNYKKKNIHFHLFSPVFEIKFWKTK